MPDDLDQLKREQMRLEIEKRALEKEFEKEKDSAMQERLKKIEKEITELKERSAATELQWKKEKETISSIRDLKKKIDKMRAESDIAERSGDLARVAEIRYGEARLRSKKS